MTQWVAGVAPRAFAGGIPPWELGAWTPGELRVMFDAREEAEDATQEWIASLFSLHLTALGVPKPPKPLHLVPDAVAARLTARDMARVQQERADRRKKRKAP